MSKEMEIQVEVQERAEVLKYVHSEWTRAINLLGGRSELIDSTFQRIVAEYESGDGRAYHNMFHVARMLRTINKVEHLANNLGALIAAAVLHDAKYDTNSQTNESDSADFGEILLEYMEVEGSHISETKRLVMVTKNHDPEADDIDGQIMNNGDYEILGSERPVYKWYCGGIYVENVVKGPYTDEQFVIGRGGYLDDFEDRIEKNTLFSITEIRNALQPQAKLNITWEKELLEKGDFQAYFN